MTTEPLMVGAAAAARILGVSRSTLYEWTRSNRVKAGRVTPGGRLRFSVRQLEALAASMTGAYDDQPARQ